MAQQPSPQAFLSTYAPRLRAYANSLLTPVLPQTAQTAPLSRTTKRGTIAINYAENEYDDDDIFEDDTGPRRPTGLRSRREDPSQGKESAAEKFGKELTRPVDVQGIWREWMGKPKLVRSGISHGANVTFLQAYKNFRTEKQLTAQAELPLTLIPIRIDLDIPSFTPAPALPIPGDPSVDPLKPQYRTPEPTPPFRLKDVFLWNLHETLITPEDFAIMMIHDLDLPNAAGLAIQVSNQIRQQLEEYAGVALHPLFHHTANTKIAESRDQSSSATPAHANGINGATAVTSQLNGHAPDAPSIAISASASKLPPSAALSTELNPDDTYRCIVSLNINLQNKLFTDKFEWSLLHPPGLAERFAKQTCADMGLTGEWIPVMTHAIYEAVLRLKKEACESGGLLAASLGEIDNDAVMGQEAGWRYDPEHLADEWEPKVEKLSKEEIEKREGDRERQIRRLRRETARFSSTANMDRGPTATANTAVGGGGSYFDVPESADTPMGRGERSKKKRRFRSLSPVGRSGTPGGRGTPDQQGGGGSGGVAGYGGSGGGLAEWERQTWRCSHCLVLGTAVWAVRDGPNGPRVSSCSFLFLPFFFQVLSWDKQSLCNNCGLAFERDRRLPPWSKNLHYADMPVGHR